MKVAFFSNFLNHHQLPLCLAFKERLGDNFVFVATSSIPEERLNMKYEDMNHKYPFVLCSYESKQNYELSQKIALEYDVVIIGSAPIEYIKKRMGVGRLTFRYCERSLKKGLWRRFIPTTYLKIYNQYIKFRKNNLYVLSASAFTSYDLSLCGFPADKCYKWGYFPELKVYEDIDEIIKHKRSVNGDTIKLLWVGRLIPLKRAELAIRLARELKLHGFTFHLDIVGNGILYNDLHKQIQKYDLSNFVTLKGALTSSETRTLMEKSDIFLFTSNQYEGWGAVINESMNSACAVVCSHVVGSAPYLIEEGVTGLMYKFDDLNSLYDHVVALISNQSYRECLARQAYIKILSEWNASVAATRFISLVNSIKENSVVPYKCGPCSMAEVINPCHQK